MESSREFALIYAPRSQNEMSVEQAFPLVQAFAQTRMSVPPFPEVSLLPARSIQLQESRGRPFRPALYFTRFELSYRWHRQEGLCHEATGVYANYIEVSPLVRLVSTHQTMNCIFSSFRSFVPFVIVHLFSLQVLSCTPIKHGADIPVCQGCKGRHSVGQTFLSARAILRKVEIVVFSESERQRRAARL